MEAALRRAHVIDAAAAEFAEKGFDGAQVGEIAARAEVSLGTVYAMFDAKEGLFQTVIENAAESIRETVRAKVEAIPDPQERLLALIDSLFACFAENEDLLRIYARATHGLPWRIRQSMGDRTQMIFASFSEWVHGLATEATATRSLEGLEADALALTLIGSVTTAAAAAAEGTSHQPLDALAGDVRRIFERLFAAGTAS
jgi:AcrR family transcriptional regulator